MATFTVDSGKRATFRESSADQNTYVINDDTKGATISGSVNGDIIAIEGFAGDFTASVSRSRVVTLKSTVDPDIIIRFQLASANNSSASVRFLDGDLTATYTTAGKKVTLGTQALTSKAAAVNDAALGSSDSSSYFDESENDVAGSNFAFGSGVTEIEGTVGNDTISAFVSGGVWDTGDIVNAKDGTDTLNLVGNGQGSAALVELNGVETINVRLLAATDINASFFGGTENIRTTTNSIDDLTLTVSGAALTNTFTVTDQSDLSVQFADLSSASDVATLEVIGAGVGSAGSAADANVIDLDKDNGGLLDTINLSVSGTNYISLEGGADLRTITLTGNGNVTLTTNDQITSLDASALSSTNFFDLTGTSNVNVKGGAGADTFRLGTTLTSNDTISGGNGSDTLTATLGASTVRGNITGVESLTLTYGGTGGSFDASATNGINSIEVNTVVAGATASLVNVDGAAVNLSESITTTFVIDTDAAKTLNLSIGSASGAAVGVSALSVTDATTVNITSQGTASNGVSALTFDNDLDNLTVTIDSTAGFTVDDDLVAAGIQTVSVVTNGSGNVNLGTAFQAASALSSISLEANVGSITFEGNIGSAAGIGGDFNLDLDANGGDITLATLDAGVTSEGNWSINIEAATNSTVTVGNIDFNLADNATAAPEVTRFTLSTVGSSNIVMGAINATGAVLSDLEVSVGASGSATVGNIAASGIGDITISGLGDRTLGNITVDEGLQSLVITGATAVVGNIAAASGGMEDITIAASGNVTLGTITLGDDLGDITISGSGNVTIGTITSDSVGDVVSTLNAGTLTINLSGVTDATTITVGSGTNIITGTQDADTINLTNGTGVDTIRVLRAATGQQGDTIDNFQVGSGDIVAVASALSIINGSGSAAAALSVQLLGTAGAVLSGDKNVFVFASETFADSSAMLAELSTWAFDGAGAGASASAMAGGNLLVAWTDDGGDSYLSLISVSASSTLANAATAAVTFATLSDVNFVSSTLVNGNFGIIAD